MLRLNCSIPSLLFNYKFFNDITLVSNQSTQIDACWQVRYIKLNFSSPVGSKGISLKQLSRQTNQLDFISSSLIYLIRKT
jgi:hypothetical protein